MITPQQWLDLAQKASQQADDLDRIVCDLRLQVRKIQSTIDSLNDLEQECKEEAEKETISLEEVIHDAQVEAQREETERGN